MLRRGQLNRSNSFDSALWIRSPAVDGWEFSWANKPQNLLWSIPLHLSLYWWGDGNTQSFGLGEQAGHLSKLSIYTCDGSISRKQREKSALWCPVYSWNFLPTAESCSSVLNSQWQVVWVNMLVNITRWLWFMDVYGRYIDLLNVVNKPTFTSTWGAPPSRNICKSDYQVGRACIKLLL